MRAGPHRARRHRRRARRTHLQTLYAAFDGRARASAPTTRTAEMIKYASNSRARHDDLVLNEIGRLCSARRRRRRGRRDARRARVGLLHRAPPGGRAGDGRHRELPRGRLRLRRQLPAEGRHGARGARARSRARHAAARAACSRSTRRSRTKLLRAGRASTIPDLRGVRSRCSVSRSSRIPTTARVAGVPDPPAPPRRRRQVSAYDPIARPEYHPDLRGVRLAAATLEDALRRGRRRGARHALGGVRRAARRCCGALGRTPLVVDGRRMFVPSAFATYEGIGR